ncbi:MAG: UPF0182 family protein [Gemmatimonadetes bacterium]|nr:UPF0182 family protein [Gemmatimonadota bacterium]
MPSRKQIVAAVIVGLLVALLGGRWLAIGVADQLWAESLGAGETHASIARVRLMLFSVAFAGAAIWCSGNLYLIYRSIGSVHVPRRLGNIEIVEAVPRHYLAIGFLVFSLVLALVLSLDAGSWWYPRALAATGTPVGFADPILQRDVSYYLFSLPWRRTLHGYVTILSAVVLGVCIILYAAAGALRVVRRRIDVADDARRHLGTLFAVLALALVWGYRLEPTEYLAGVHNVPFDSVLIDVRLPTAKLLSAVGLLTCLASVLWIRSARVGLVVFGWGALGALSLLGHYVVPAVAAAVRTDDQLRAPLLTEAHETLTRFAYGLADVAVDMQASPRLDPRISAIDAPELATPVVWDVLAIDRLLNRDLRGEPYYHFASISPGGYRVSRERRVPVLIGVREVDLAVARDLDPAMSWERIHLRPYGVARGAVAVRADLVGPGGSPMFIPDLTRPDSAVSVPVDLVLGDSIMLFGPTTSEFAVVPEGAARGVVRGGFLRRLALAWRLQSSRLLTSPALTRSSVVLWHRSVRERLGRVAPFADFESPHAVIADGRVMWTAFGYVASNGFPLAARTRWLDRGVGYLRAGFFGVVDAVTGETSVYLVPRPDPLSKLWAEFAPDVVKSWDELPHEVREHVHYPEEMFRTQLELLRDRGPQRRPEFFGRVRGGSSNPGTAPAPYWWFGPTPDDSIPRLRRLATLEEGEPARLAGLVEGSSDARGPTLAVHRFQLPWDIAGSATTVGRFVTERGVDLGVVGPLKTVRVGDGVFSLQSTYMTSPGDADDGGHVSELLSVAVAWGGAIGEGGTFEEALLDALASERSPELAAIDWAAARRWFERLDAARQSGDWSAFGIAYEALRVLLTENAGRSP